MGKLIDADALMEALSINPEMCPGCPEPEWLQELSDLFDTTEESVVRCKDCEWYSEVRVKRNGKMIEEAYVCCRGEWSATGTDPNGYCSYGRRKG